MSDLISRQVALSFLRNWERVKDYSWGERNIIKATINEIESLPSAQPEIEERTEEFVQNVPKEDLISRKAAIDALDNIKIPRNASWYPYYQQALTVMSRLPSAQPERKKGKWINIRHDNIAECDQCGTIGEAWMNFCFICGADMRGDDRD